MSPTRVYSSDISEVRFNAASLWFVIIILRFADTYLQLPYTHVALLHIHKRCGYFVFPFLHNSRFRFLRSFIISEVHIRSHSRISEDRLVWFFYARKLSVTTK